MGGRTARFTQSMQEISTPKGVYYWGWFQSGSVLCGYELEFCLETTLTLWKNGEELKLEDDEREFFLRKLGEFSRAESYPRPQPSSIGDQGSVAGACSILHRLIIRREITAEVREILGRPKFGCTFE